MTVAAFQPTFRPGQKVRAVHSYAHRLVAGEVYTVTGTLPPTHHPNFTFPEYVEVMDSFGNKSEWYPYRFAAT
jgi:hypothetical protein